MNRIENKLEVRLTKVHSLPVQNISKERRQGMNEPNSNKKPVIKTRNHQQNCCWSYYNLF